MLSGITEPFIYNLNLIYRGTPKRRQTGLDCHRRRLSHVPRHDHHNFFRVLNSLLLQVCLFIVVFPTSLFRPLDAGYFVIELESHHH